MSQNENVFEEKRTLEAWDDDYYHPVAEQYYDAAIPNMLKLMGVKPGSRLLDAGCGPGVHSIRAASAGYQVHAIDISETMLTEARRRAEKAGVGSLIDFQKEDLTALSFGDNAFEYIFSWGVLIHIPEVDKALDELVRMLAPGGKLAIYVTNQAAWDHKIEQLARRILRRPASDEQRALGTGRWYEMSGHRLWVLQFDIDALTTGLERRGLRRTHRVVGEFSELQRRTGGWARIALLRLNNLVYRFRIGTGAAVANLLIFEKPESPT